MWFLRVYFTRSTAEKQSQHTYKARSAQDGEGEEVWVEGRGRSRLSARSHRGTRTKICNRPPMCFPVPLRDPVQETNYIFPAFMSATRFKVCGVDLVRLPRAIAWSASASASSCGPPHKVPRLGERFWKVSLTLIDWSAHLIASSHLSSPA